MKYSIIEGIVHPRIGEDLSHKNLTFYNLSDSESIVIIIRNIMKDILNPSKDKCIRYVLEDYFRYRAINIEDENPTIKNILDFFNVYEEKYYNKTGFNFYLVKRDGDSILDVIDCWKCKRESKREYTKTRRKKKSFI